MNHELALIILTMSTHRIFTSSNLCNVVHMQFSKIDDRCYGDRCKVCPLGVSHLSSGYLWKVFSLRII